MRRRSPIMDNPQTGNIDSRETTTAQDPNGFNANQQFGVTPEAATTQVIDSSAMANMPVVAGWKTSGLFSALGFITSFLVLWMALVVAFAAIIAISLGEAAGAFTTTNYGQLAGYPASIVLNVLTIVYAAVFYRSYFTDKPRLRSNKAISFFNLMFGGILFGCLWNNNLKRSRLLERKATGSSYKVAIVLSAITICLMGYNVATYEMPLLNQAKAYYGQTIGQSPSSPTPKNNTETLHDSLTGATITVPSGWKSSPIENAKSGQFQGILLPENGNDDVAIMVSTMDAYAALPDDARAKMPREAVNNDLISEKTILKQNRYDAGSGSIESEEAELVELNGISYWKAKTVATTSSSLSYVKEGTPITTIGYYRYDDGYYYGFMLACLGATSNDSESFAADLEKVVASTNYK